MDRLEHAIFRTVLYGDVFDFPMTAREIHHFLIDEQPASCEAVERTIAGSMALASALICVDGYFACAGRESIVALRKEREQVVARMWPQALRYGRWLSRLPFVRMVGLTGALAIRNAYDGDDIDYMLITVPGRVWMARALAIGIVRAARLQGVIVCPNYVVADDALEQSRRDLFIAHELAQMIPLYGHDLYWRLRQTNPWAEAHLPNAGAALYATDEQSLGRGWETIKRVGEAALGGRLGNALETWEHQRKVRRFAKKMRQQQEHAAQIDRTQVKGHFSDHGSRILRKYQARLRQHGLIDAAAPGD